jgi:hypothetical protein
MVDRATELRRRLDELPAAGETPRLALLDFDVVMRTPSPELAEYLTGLYAPLHAAGTAQHVLTLSTTGTADVPGVWSVHLDATRVISTPAPSVAFHYLLWEANRQAIDSTPDRVLVHASAAVAGDVAILFPGPMGAGKSTLVAALVREGLGYLTDEVVALDPVTGLVRPYPKYLSLGGALAHLVPEPPAAVRHFVGDQSLVPPDGLRPGAVSAAARPRIVVAPRYERGATTSIEPLRPAAALSVLAQHAFHIADDGQRTLDVLARVVRESSCFELVSGDVAEATTSLLAVIEDVAARPNRTAAAS